MTIVYKFLRMVVNTCLWWLKAAFHLVAPQDESDGPCHTRSGCQTGENSVPFRTLEEFGCWMVAQMPKLTALELSLNHLPISAPECGAGLKHLVLCTDLACSDTSGCSVAQQVRVSSMLLKP